MGEAANVIVRQGPGSPVGRDEVEAHVLPHHM